MGTGPSGHAGAIIARFLHDIPFPAHRNDIIAHAKKNDADEEVMMFLDHLPDQEFPDYLTVLEQYNDIRGMT